MAFTVGRYGIGSILVLGHMLIAIYMTCALFVFGVLGTIARFYGFSLLRFIRYIADEVLVVFGTCSSESVLPRLIEKLTRLGCSRSSVGLVLPVGYSFNADGTAIYLSMASLFIAQAYGIDMSLSKQFGLLCRLQYPPEAEQRSARWRSGACEYSGSSRCSHKSRRWLLS